MTAFPYMDKCIEDFTAQHEELRATIKAAIVLKDEFSLDDRWALFIKSKNILEIETYGNGNIRVLNPNGNLYDDFHTERYQTRFYDDMDEQIQDTLSYLDYRGDEDWSIQAREEAERLGPNYDAWREAVLADGCAGFIYDW